MFKLYKILITILYTEADVLSDIIEAALQRANLIGYENDVEGALKLLGLDSLLNATMAG